MTGTKPFTLDDLMAEWSEDPEFVKADKRLQPYFEVAKDIFELRKEMGLTQQQLAKAARTHQSRISKIEAADMDCRLSTLISIADALDACLHVSMAKNWHFSNAEFHKLFKTDVSTGTDETPIASANPVFHRLSS